MCKDTSFWIGCRFGMCLGINFSYKKSLVFASAKPILSWCQLLNFKLFASAKPMQNQLESCFRFFYYLSSSWAWPTHKKLLLYFLFFCIGLANDKWAPNLRPHLADANELCIEEMGVVHLTVAGPTRSSFYRGFLAGSVHLWPTQMAYILVVLRKMVVFMLQ